MRRINKIQFITKLIMHEVDKACPQINYVDKVNPKNIYKGVLTGIERAFSSSMDFPPKSLLDREKSAAAEITFHLQRKNFHQIQLEVEDLIDLTNNLEPNQYEYEDDDLPF